MRPQRKYTKRYNKPFIYKHRKTNRGGAWPFTSSPKDGEEPTDNDKPLQNKEVEVNIYTTDKISLQSIPKNYTAIGILHITESTAINALREAGTGILNLFGNKGFDNTIYDKLRQDTFEMINSKLKDGQKVFNLKFDFETNAQGTTIFIHLYGDLCEPRKIKTADEDRLNSDNDDNDDNNKDDS
jgi:hypothetical protein